MRDDGGPEAAETLMFGRSRKIRRNGLWERGRDGGFCHKHADLRTVTEYPGGEVQVGTWKYRCKTQGEIKQDES